METVHESYEENKIFSRGWIQLDSDLGHMIGNAETGHGMCYLRSKLDNRHEYDIRSSTTSASR